MYEPTRGDRVSAYDDVDNRTLHGTVCGKDWNGDTLIRWDTEDYDGCSRGHSISPDDHHLLTKTGTVSKWLIDRIDPRGEP